VWHFAAGSVTQSTGEVLTLFNPFPDKAVVDVRFATSDGFRSPPDYQSLPIPAGGLVVVDAFAAVARHDQVSATVQAKSGRIVADRIVNYGGPPRGLSLALGAPEPAPAWWFPDGHSGDGLSDTYVVYNPSDSPAEVDLDVALDDPDTNGEVDPVPVTVDPHAYALVAMNDQQRVPAGVGHHVAVRSRNGVPIVAERHFVSADPAPQTGVADTLGAPLAGTHWVLAGAVSDTATQEFVVVANPSSDSIARVRVFGLASGRFVPIEGLDAVEVGPNSRVVMDLGALAPADQLPLVVTSSQPVVVEQSLYTIEGPGLSATMGVPLANGAGMLPG
jgi:hypothetical protein